MADTCEWHPTHPTRPQNNGKRALAHLRRSPDGLRHGDPPPLHTHPFPAQHRGSNSYALAQRHPNLNLTPEEKRVFYQLFQAADTTNLGVITGEIAVPFFEKTHLSPDTLGLVCGH